MQQKICVWMGAVGGCAGRQCDAASGCFWPPAGVAAGAGEADAGQQVGSGLPVQFK